MRIVRKREDGYHDLETVFYPVYGLHDELEISITDSPFSFEQDGLSMDCSPDDNLIVRCYRLMKDKYPQIGDVHIRLRKQIPFGAGLGGGSSDAAHTAIALNKLFSLGLSREQMAQEVRVLGADCPFFVYNTPCFATGIGDVLTPIPLSLDGRRLVMVKPSVSVSTREAYAGIRPNAAPFDRNVNDFEKTVFARHPEIGEIKQRLLDAGAEYAAMSGSGSTVFGLFHGDTECGSNMRFRRFYEDFASMIIFNDTL